MWETHKPELFGVGVCLLLLAPLRTILKHVWHPPAHRLPTVLASAAIGLLAYIAASRKIIPADLMPAVLLLLFKLDAAGFLYWMTGTDSWASL